jgi:tetratricopeptide (TPR) repeat protein
MELSDSAVQVMEERVMFARDISPEVNACLQSAVACADDFERARALLYQARDLDPDQLEVYIALYKFLFYRGKLDEAEQVAEQALQRAASSGGFNEDWQQLTTASCDWSQEDGPARTYLYSLKALAFISLRKGKHDRGRALLNKLQQLDPEDLVGGSVIGQLAEAL